MLDKKIVWEEIARRGDNHPIILIAKVMEGYRRGWWGLKQGETELKIKYYRQLAGARWLSVEDMENYVNFLKNKELTNPGILVDYASEFKRRVNLVKNFTDEYKNQTWAELDSKKLSEVFAKFIELTSRMWAFAYNYAIANRFLSDIIFAAIAKQEPDLHKQTEYFNILMQLDDASEMRKEKINLLKIAEQVEAGGFNAEIDDLIAEHLKKYEYLSQYYYRGSPYTAPVIKERIEHVISEGAENEWSKIKQIESDLERAEELKKTLQLDEKTLKHIESARAQAAISNYVDEVYTYAVFYLKPLYVEVAKRLGLSYSQLVDMWGEEIISSLLTSELAVPLEKINERKKECAIILEGEEIKVLSGRELEEYKKQELKSLDYSRVDELTGQGASSGRTQGAVKLVLCDADAGKVLKGDILLAPATNPTLVPAMERAAAIVTDEGGLLSHAAIVSRELGIPCLVGTKIGTKVFKDGDMVEVDTKNGLIRKI